MKKLLGWLVLCLGVVTFVAWLAFTLSPALQDAVFAAGARRQLARQSQLPTSDDALRVLLCGTSSPLPVRQSAKACALVVAGGRFFIVDIGPESTKNLAIWRIPATRVEAVFLTHFHSDHIGALGDLNMQLWAQGRSRPLDVYGPTGVDRVVAGFNLAYSFDRDYRHALHSHGGDMLPLAAAVMIPHPADFVKPGDVPSGRTQVVYDQGGVVVTAIEADHRPVSPAFAYRFDYKGHSVVITGDTVFNAGLARAAKGADVLVSEAQAHHLQNVMASEAAAIGQTTLASVLKDTSRYHISPVDAARLANQAGVRDLVYTHIAPPLVFGFLKTPWLRGVNEVRPHGVTIGRDGMLITIPLDGSAVRFSQLDG
ncbi:MBL fold metallo-hydrolase [Sphingomonas sp. AR_OL41]|uniref:MBL fold metallo-hydrolase n=1 Tax=Sphingomonas sp. AR_OL41 TaxID=3042729 RepID=UPI002480DAC3|nr:MBL fold metallo-hydrolase [Sphingomonas sp. AR_OL41]MDH7972110.1 MBL fold metallo-hydrolase [Sphingomonas sp. AR_OL41]